MGFVVKDKPAVRIVLDVLTFDEILDVVKRLIRPVDKFQDAHHTNINLFGRTMAIVFFGPQLSVQLQFHFCKIDVALDGANVSFSHSIVAITAPILQFSNKDYFKIQKFF